MWKLSSLGRTYYPSIFFFMVFHCLQPDGHAHKAARHEVSMRTITPMKQPTVNMNSWVRKKKVHLWSKFVIEVDQSGSGRIRDVSTESWGRNAPAGLLVLSDHCLLSPSPSSQVHPLFAQNRFDTEVREKWVLRACRHVLPNMEHNLTSVVLTSTAGLWYH